MLALISAGFAPGVWATRTCRAAGAMASLAIDSLRQVPEKDRDQDLAPGWRSVLCGYPLWQNMHS